MSARKYSNQCRPKSAISILHLFRFTALFLLLPIISGCGGRNGQAGVEVGTGPVTPVSGPVLNDFILGPGDEISIEVFGQNELGRKVVVGPNGEFYYPLLGYINVVDMQSKELRSYLTDGLSKYYVEPDVSIIITAVKSQKIFVLGEVAQPGVFPVGLPTTVFEVVLRAGGFNERAKKSSIVLIRGYGGAEPEIKKLNLEKIYQDGNFGDDLYVQGGDIVYVPQNLITNIEDVLVHVDTFIRPLLDVERSVIWWPDFVDVLEGQNSKGRIR